MAADADILAEVNSVIEEGVHRGNPNAKVIAWDWGWRGHGEATDIIARLPPAVWLMSVSEWDKQIEADSQSGKLDFLVKEAMDEKSRGKLREL